MPRADAPAIALSRSPFFSLATAVLCTLASAQVARAETHPPLTPSPAAHYPAGTHYKPLCPNPDEQGRRCFGQILVDADEKPITDATSPPGGWTPGELEAAYGLPASGGKGTIIATYIGNHYTNLESDVAAYRTKFGMSSCTIANGCLVQVTDSGGTDFSGLSDDGCSGFVGEESLDVDMLMAGCPNCKIVVMEGGDHAAAIKTAAKLGAVSMSMSWGYGASASDCDSVWIPVPGLALFGASGDNGYTASPGAPSACSQIIAVGWTQLATDSSARGYADTIPNGWGSAGGCDPTISKASWQKDTGCSSRMISDISANGDNVAAYCTSPAGSANWHVTGGSSASSPFTTGALATLGITGGTFDAAWLYANQKKFWDVTTGGPVSNCASGSPTYYCTPVAGYDGPTGVGTPYGPMLVGGGDAGSCVTPGGSYLQSCSGCAAEASGAGCVLTCATCKEINGTDNPDPTLNLPCNGTVENNNGMLVCTPSASADGGTDDDGGAGISDGGGGVGLDATLPPPILDAGGSSDAGHVAPSGDGSVSSGGEDAGDGSGATGKSGCGCTQAKGDETPISLALGGGLVLALGWRRRRRSEGDSSKR